MASTPSVACVSIPSARVTLRTEELWDQSSGLEGAFGLRAGTAKSSDLLGTVTHPDSIHFTPDLGDFYLMGEGLGRHYLDPMGPDVIETRVRDKCLYCAGGACPGMNPFPVRLPDWKTGWTPGGETDPVLPPWWKDWPRPWNDGPIEAVLVQGQSGWGPVDDEGGILQIDGLISQTLRDNLSDTALMFVHAAEPQVGTGRGYENVQGLMMRKDATAIVDSVLASPSGIAMATERPIIKRMSSSAARAARDLSSIPARTGFVPVLSRTLGALVLAGGTDGSGQLTHELWMVPQWGEPSLLETPAYQPQEVLAATVATADGMLWVLDEYRAFGWLRVARLVRIDTLSGEHEIVWQGPRLGLFDRHWLGVDRDGQVLLFGSSERFRKHVTVRFEATPFVLGTAQPRLMRFGRGDLLGEPLVDAHGYQFITRRGSKRFDVERIGSLERLSKLGVDLKKCL